jgi:hypothetical protein
MESVVRPGAATLRAELAMCSLPDQLPSPPATVDTGSGSDVLPSAEELGEVRRGGPALVLNYGEAAEVLKRASR